MFYAENKIKQNKPTTKKQKQNNKTKQRTK